ncbi:MAG: hypothetical protein LUQ44_02120 [Methanothrix sp.]|nr:hypothetical protein [Methanothrix sp.]
MYSTLSQQQGCQSTLISPELLFDQSLMNFSMENTTSEILQALAQELMAAFAVGAGFM